MKEIICNYSDLVLIDTIKTKGKYLFFSIDRNKRIYTKIFSDNKSETFTKFLREASKKLNSNFFAIDYAYWSRNLTQELRNHGIGLIQIHPLTLNRYRGIIEKAINKETQHEQSLSSKKPAKRKKH